MRAGLPYPPCSRARSPSDASSRRSTMVTSWIPLLCLCGVVRAAAPPTEDRLSATSAALQKVIKDMLGFKNLPRTSNPETGRPLEATPRNINVAPRYMLDLYDRYRDASAIKRHGMTANTVRSIAAQIGIVRSQNVFIFNLSAIAATERILRAEIHVFKRDRKRNRTEASIVMGIHELGPDYISTTGRRTIHSRATGWQASDVTSALTSCLRHGDPAATARLLAVSFYKDKGKGILRQMGMSSTIRRLSRPYLIVFSNDTQNITLDHIQPHLDPLDLRRTYVDPQSGARKHFRGNRKHSRKHGSLLDIMVAHGGGGKSGSSEDGGTTDGEESGEVRVRDEFVHESLGAVAKDTAHDKPGSDVSPNAERRRRSIMDNTIPKDPHEPMEIENEVLTPPHRKRYHKVLSKTHPGVLQGHVTSRHKASPPAVPEDPSDSSRLIPYPEGHHARRQARRRRRRKHRRRKQQQGRGGGGGGRGGRLSTLPGDWGLDSHLTAGERGLCGLQHMTVDFADIGWKEWMISPKRFEANYCAGSCPFPLAEKVRPSNHAMIQSLMHAVGIHPGVPAPCCSPDVLDSVTLLYFDESKNIVLKNYPGMSVKSCSCR